MLHKANPDTSRLDRLAAKVLRAAVVWERARHESGRSYNEPPEAQALDDAVTLYRLALVDETVPGDADVPAEDASAACPV